MIIGLQLNTLQNSLRQEEVLGCECLYGVESLDKSCRFIHPSQWRCGFQSQKKNNDFGVETVLPGSQVFTDAIIDSLAETMSTDVHTIIEEKSAEMTALKTK